MSDTASLPVSLSSLPWAPPSLEMRGIRGGRPFLMVPDGIQAARIDGLADALPQVPIAGGDGRPARRRFELPATGGESEQGPVCERLCVRLQRPSGPTETVGVLLEAGLPRPSAKRFLTQADGSPPAVNAWQAAGDAAYALIGQHVELVNRLLEQDAWALDSPWSGKASFVVARSLESVLATWRDMASQNEPQMALIVHLARNIPRLLLDVCRRPRQVLSRQRQLLNAGRVQELDGTCIRWLARQPGTSVAQKAGTRQEILGIVRVEDADTPENRVVRDLVCRAIVACNRYLAEYRSFRNSERVADVRRFLHLLRDLRRHSAIAFVHELAGVPAANYVLQHDPRYSVLWHYYVLLVRQQMQQDQAWRWRHRIWAEECLLAVLAALQSLASDSPALCSDIWLHSEHVQGRFSDPCTGLGAWWLSQSGECAAVDFVRGEDLARYAQAIAIPTTLCELGPDAVLVRRSLSHPQWPVRALGLWAVLDFGLEQDHLLAHTQQLGQRLAAEPAGRVRGLLLQPQMTQDPAASPSLVTAEGCTGCRLPYGLQRHSSLLAEQIRRGLQLP